jgi:hypothetical protein
VLLTLVQRGLVPPATLEHVEDLVRRPLDAPLRATVLDGFATVFWGLAAVMVVGLFTFIRIEERPLSNVAPHA